MNYILIGMPWSGKSTIWKILAQKLNLKFLDFDDDVIEWYQNKTVSDRVKSMSQKDFIAFEEKLCLNLSFEYTVFSTSWSLPYSQKSIKHLKSLWKIIYLKVDISEIKARIWSMKTLRIIGFEWNNLDELLKERESLYTNAADIIFNYSGNNIEEISQNLTQRLWHIPTK